ncbi:MAG: hypothetical protein IOD12_00735 [Silvanigrellales bacterium]|nr:hypothetical protein [Silvanigrellales bacterium]
MRTALFHTLGAWLGAALLSGCGSFPSGSQKKNAAWEGVPFFSIESEGRPLLALDAEGRFRVGDKGTRGALFSHSFVLSAGSAPFLKFDGFTLGKGASAGASAWQNGGVPSYAPPVGGACDVTAEMETLELLFEGSDLPPFGGRTRAGSPCRTKAFLACFVRSWSEPSPVDGRSFAELWAQERNQVSPDVVFALAQAAQRAADCAGIEPTIGQGGQGAPGGKNSGGSFALSATSLLFTPSPLLSLSIYAGALESYDDALVNASPVALVAVPDTCISVGGACVASPWPLSKCKGCEALVRGKTYTAFLLEKPGQLLRDVKRVPFVR